MWTPNVVLFRESTRSVFAPNSVICVFKDEPLPNRSTENEVTLFVDMETGETAIDPPDSLAVREVSFDCHSVRASVDPIVPDSLEEDKAFQNFLLRGQDLRGKIDHLLSLWSTVPVPETSELGRWERESSALDQEEAFNKSAEEIYEEVYFSAKGQLCARHPEAEADLTDPPPLYEIVEIHM